MNINLSNHNNFSQNNLRKNNSNNISFNAFRCKHPTAWSYRDWLNNTMDQLPAKTRRELMERYGGPKKASSLDVFAENINGIFYPITRLCSTFKNLITGKKCIKVVEDPHKYPYAIRKEFYSDGSSKEMEYDYGVSQKLINMWEKNKDGKPTRSVEYSWNIGDYTIRIYNEDRRVTKVYPSVKHPYYPRLGSS